MVITMVKLSWVKTSHHPEIQEKGPILHTPLPLTTPPHSGSGKAVLCDQKQGERTLVKKGVRADWEARHGH